MKSEKKLFYERPKQEVVVLEVTEPLLNGSDEFDDGTGGKGGEEAGDV